MTAPLVPLLTARQQQILGFVRAFHGRYGFAPSMREIGAAVGLVSVSSVRYQVTVLERAGWIRREPGLPRALVVLDPADGGLS